MCCITIFLECLFLDFYDLILFHFTEWAKIPPKLQLREAILFASKIWPAKFEEKNTKKR